MILPPFVITLKPEEDLGFFSIIGHCIDEKDGQIFMDRVK